MHRLRTLATSAALGMLGGMAVAAPQTPLPIDGPGPASRSVLTMLSAFGDASVPISLHLDMSRRLAESALKSLAAVTTPAALMASPRGISIPCPSGGNLLAKLPRTGPRVLDLTWTGCATTQDISTTTYEGRGQLGLPGNTFTPTTLHLIRLGTATQDFTATNTDSESPPGSSFQRAFNLRIDGCVSMVRFQNNPFGIFVGDVNFTLNGFIVSTSTFPLGDPGAPLFVSSQTNTAENYVASGSTWHTDGDTVLHQTLTVLLGKAGLTSRDSNQNFTDWGGFSWDGMRVSWVLDARTGASTQTVDGKLTRRWPPYVNGTCGDGLYRFRTLEPIRQTNMFRYNSRDAGKVVFNDGAVATFSVASSATEPSWYTPQPGELPTNVTVTMRNGQTFSHDSYFPSASLQDFQSCTP